MPGIFAYRSFADAGGLLSYGADPRALLEKAAAIADKIFKGSKPADLPVEQPTRFELTVNLRTAAVFYLSVPESVLLRANEVIR
jgi:putative ABC transport system substrate-binding protein